jgi:hypothetical protein
MTPRGQVVTLCGVAVITGLLQFFTRVHVPRDPGERDFAAELQLASVEPVSLATAREHLQTWFPESAAADGPGAAEMGVLPELEPGGLPDRGELGGLRFLLRGVFDSGEPFAVFEVTPRAGGATERVMMSAGNTIQGIRLDSVGGRQAVLTDGQNTIRLALFLHDQGQDSFNR